MHPELRQYLLYADAMTDIFQPARTVRDAEHQRQALKAGLGLLRRATATTADADVKVHLGQQLRDLKRLHYYMILDERALSHRATRRN